jgi:hypothetical protein
MSKYVGDGNIVDFVTKGYADIVFNLNLFQQFFLLNWSKRQMLPLFINTSFPL